ncbi:MAG: hypothetical protein ACLUJR_04875 [Mediterraneibacter gnavus]
MFVVSVCSLFIGVMDADLASLMQGDPEVIRLFLISRDSAASGNSVYRNRNEYSRADHAAALYE